MIVQLHEAARARLKAIARARNDSKAGVRNRRVADDLGDLAINFLGLLGEYAFEVFSGIPIDETISPGGDGGAVDFILPDGTTVQVKFTKRAGGSLYFRTVDVLRADLAVLVVPSGWTAGRIEAVRLAGWMTREVFAARCRVEVFGRYGEHVTVPQGLLFPMATLAGFGEARVQGRDG